MTKTISVAELEKQLPYRQPHLAAEGIEIIGLVAERGGAGGVADMFVRVEDVVDREGDAQAARPGPAAEAADLGEIRVEPEIRSGEIGEEQVPGAPAGRKPAAHHGAALPIGGEPETEAVLGDAPLRLDPMARLPARSADRAAVQQIDHRHARA